MGVGKIQEFDIKSGNWTGYCERLDMYFLVNEVKDASKLPTLIAVMGEEAYLLLSTLASPKKPKDLTYGDAVSLLKNHLQPKPSVLAERYRFRQRRQVDGESISDYVAELKKLAKTCDFGNNLEENLRDQMVCGIISESTRQRLFAEDDSITYSRAFKLATTLEAAEKNAYAVERDNEKTIPVNKVQNNHKCMVCGDHGHKTENCKYKNFECSYCRNLGHLRRMCPGKSVRLETAGTAGNHSREPRGMSVTFNGSGGRGGRRGGRGYGGRAAGSARGARGGGHWRAGHGSGWENYCMQEHEVSADQQLGQGSSSEYDASSPKIDDDYDEESDDYNEPMYQMSLTKYRPA